MNFCRQKTQLFDEQLKLLENCRNLNPDEVILASHVSAVIKFDMSNCKVLKEPVVINSIVLYFRKHHYLLQAVNQKISLFKAAGLIDVFVSRFSRATSKRVGKNDPKVMTFYDLSGTFKVLLIGLLLAFLIFIVELLTIIRQRL